MLTPEQRLERVLSRLQAQPPSAAAPPVPSTPQPVPVAPTSTRCAPQPQPVTPAAPPSTLDIRSALRAELLRLAEVYKAGGDMRDALLEAENFARASFPPERRHRALQDYTAHYSSDDPRQNAMHAAALRAWACHARAVGYGKYIEGAAALLGVELPN